MPDLTTAKGGSIDVTTTPHSEVLTDENLKVFAETLHIWNTGSTDVRVSINEIEADFTVGTAALIPTGEDQYFVTTRKPIKNFIVATESGTSTVKYTAF